jgi:catalase
MTEAPDTQRTPLHGAAALARFALIGVVLLVVVGAFGYVGGWFSPNRLTQDRIIDAFESTGGDHPGFRHNHAKGICVTGWFESNGNAAAVSKAAVFAVGRVPLVGRFALAGGMPSQADKPVTVRSMALRFVAPGGQEWRTGMNNIPVFPVNSAQGFYEQLLAFRPDPASGKPDPAAVQDFLARHPETGRAMSLIRARAVSSSFADSTFNSLNAFRMDNASGVSVPVRWAAVPLPEVTAAGDPPSAGADPNYLFDDLIARIHRQPQQWRLVITVGEPGDRTDDATLPWPEGRQQVDAGVVSIDHVSSEDSGSASCTDINYDPLVLPSGIEPSDDPLLSARSAVYASSFTLRAAEKRKKAPSAVTPREVQTAETR